MGLNVAAKIRGAKELGDFVKRQARANGLAHHIERGYVELLEKMLDCAKQLQLKPEELRNEVLLSIDNSAQMAWLMAAISGKFKLLEKLWDWTKL